jgi:phosphoglycolate phosphatase
VRPTGPRTRPTWQATRGRRPTEGVVGRRRTLALDVGRPALGLQPSSGPRQQCELAHDVPQEPGSSSSLALGCDGAASGAGILLARWLPVPKLRRMGERPASAELRIRTVLFDLDGTLSKSESGIIGSLRQAFDDLGLPRLDDRTERSLIGPTFADALPPLVGADIVPKLIERYRAHYATGMFDTELYDGALEVLDDLRARGVTLAVATSKPEFHAKPVIDHLGLADYFVTVAGDSLNYERRTKALVIAEALRRLGHPDPATVLMVGDRKHDVEGAAAHGIPTIGAGWGYGQPGELVEAGAVEVFPVPRDLLVAHGRLLMFDNRGAIGVVSRGGHNAARGRLSAANGEHTSLAGQ